jgi:hypothetical protein
MQTDQLRQQQIKADQAAQQAQQAQNASSNPAAPPQDNTPKSGF